ncbi:MAG: hypothetical protein ABI233_08710 [Chthoniobacterales bacterium]
MGFAGGGTRRPTVSAEYRRRRWRLNLVQSLNLFGFLPLAAWAGFEFLDALDLQILYFAAVAAVFGFLEHIAQRNFRCPVCGMTFPVLRQSNYNISQRRLEMSYSSFRWCDNCAARFELYPESAPEPPREDDGIL